MVGKDILVVAHQKEKPNWPDAEFPWRLRTEERDEKAKAVQKNDYGGSSVISIVIQMKKTMKKWH
jgi:hypothetical protein